MEGLSKMQNNSRKRKAFSQLSLTYHSTKLAKIGAVDPKFNEESLISQVSCEKDSIQHKIKTFSECSPATMNYLKHNNWGSDVVKENNIIYHSKNISNASGNTHNPVPEKKIKYIPDCSPMTQNMMTNHQTEYFESQDELELLTCSINSNSTTPKLKEVNNMQSFSLSDNCNDEFQYLGQEKNKENMHFYFDSNISKASTSSFKLLCSAPSNLSDDNFDRETLLLSGFSPLSVSQQSNPEDELNFEKLTQKRSQLELKKHSSLLSDVCCEYDEFEKKILCAPKIKIDNNKNNIKLMNIDEIQQSIYQNITFLKRNFI